MEGLMARGWDPIPPGCRWLHEPQPISDQPDRGVGGFHTVRGGIDPMNNLFCARFVRLVDAWKDFLSWDGALSPVGGGGSMILSQQRSANGVGGYTPSGAVSTWGTTVFVPGSSK